MHWNSAYGIGPTGEPTFHNLDVIEDLSVEEDAD